MNNLKEQNSANYKTSWKDLERTSYKILKILNLV